MNVLLKTALFVRSMECARVIEEEEQSEKVPVGRTASAKKLGHKAGIGKSKAKAKKANEGSKKKKHGGPMKAKKVMKRKGPQME